MKLKRFLNAVVIATLLTGLLMLGGQPTFAADRDTPVQKAVKASVFIVMLDEKGDMLGSGSGSILTSDGMILSNFHVVGDLEKKTLNNSKGLIAIGVLDDPTEPPVVNYLAQVVQVDPDLDLSVSCIISDLKNRPLKNVSFPTVPIGDADGLFLGDNITVIGFPGIGFGEHQDTPSLTFSKGSVAGFESKDKVKIWIKSDAATGPGDSGAMVVNDAGEIIGVHTQGWSDPKSAARLSAERPINRAYGLIKKAQASGCSGGVPTTTTTSTPPTPTTGNAGNATIGALTFAEDLDKNNKPIKPGTSFKTGLKAVSAIFAFTNMKNSLNWAPIWYLDGEAVINKSYKWDAGASGTQARTLSSKSSLPDGAYRLEIVVEGNVLQKGSFTIGSTTTPSKPSNGDGVEVTGTIVDADTNKPIAGAAFIVLQPGITYDAWDGGQESILTYAAADKRGVFKLPDLVPRGQSYTIVAGAKGYNDNFEDGVAVDDNTPDTVDLNLTLQKP
jgi:S1-C subfamily serine protease